MGTADRPANALSSMLGDRPETQAGADNLKSREGTPHSARRIMSRRFPPWSIEEGTACFIVRDHDKQALAYGSSDRGCGVSTRSHVAEELCEMAVRKTDFVRWA